MSGNAVRRHDPNDGPVQIRHIDLESGGRVSVVSKKDGERVQISAGDDRLFMEIRFTPEGPVVSLDGACLELSATREISLDAEKVNIRSKKNTEISSHGTLKIDIQEDVDLQSDQEIRLQGKMIHLN